jgi:hypothetical protein
LLIAHFTFLICPARAQTFFNLTADEVRIDSVLPVFSHTVRLGAGYADSTYTVTIEYPEFIPMSQADVEGYLRLAATAEPLQPLPQVSQMLGVERKQGVLHVSFVPLVFRDGQYQKLVSFKLNVKGRRLSKRMLRMQAQRRAGAARRYADNSVLSSGTWVKIRIPSTGIYQLTSDFVRKAGFTDINKVKIYGYGGALQPEKLTADYLASTDDLQELPTCEVSGKRLFYGVGPVSWDASYRRVRNPYSDYGYYFLTQNDSTPATLTQEEFGSRYYPMADDYCTLYEVDDYAWFHGGRNLYNAQLLTNGAANHYTVAAAGTSENGRVTVSISAANGASVAVSINGTQVGTINVAKNGSLEKMRIATQTYNIGNLQASNQIGLTPTATSGEVRLDYISTYSQQPVAAQSLTQTFPTPEYLYQITNQNHHAATPVDMVIIIPTTQKLLAQAERLKLLHEQHDSLRVRIVPADELFNEFSSGTPDANAYRRYMKMLYDRAQTDDDIPRYLVLLGDGAWDNRMRISDWQSCSPDDFLLCYESENSYSETECYVSDDYFCLLDDNEGGSMLTSDMADVAVGRISARTADEAAGVIDKIERYIGHQDAGSWQNVICFMGDDGNQNQHMDDADSVAQSVEMMYPTMVVKRIMWDAYTRVSSTTGNTYPDVTRLIKQQIQQGALIMNYSGHGSATLMSHESVMKLADFEAVNSMRLPLWITASCDIMPFDGQEENIGETCVFNKKGGAIAFYGTTRTVYQNYNRLMNLAFTRHVLSRDSEGRPIPIGEAVRRTKNELISRRQDLRENKLQYTLLGDPALRLAIATRQMEVDSINGQAMTEGSMMTLKAGTKATVSGKVLTDDGQTDTDFDGQVTALVRDIRELITCKLNDTTGDGADEPFTYYDRPNTVFSGSNVVKNGRFTFSFAVPKDIKYSDLPVLINLYAINNAKTLTANGICEQLALNGTQEKGGSNVGPDIYCYLNSTSFTNGDKVNTTPYFMAELNDEDGINASGSGIGHDLQLVIDGEAQKTYTLNDAFQFDFGSYTSGKLGFSIPELSYGQHTLQFRAWDVLNNSSTVELSFEVAKGVGPTIADIDCTPNPATTHTRFRILHDRVGGQMDVKLDVFDMSGRHLWAYTDSGVASDNTYTVDWDLTVDGGRRLQTGVYLYRLSISTDGSTYATKAKKLIVLTHK